MTETNELDGLPGLGSVDGKRIVVVSNSLREAKEIRESLTADFPQKKIELYSSETPQSKKALHFADVEKYWASVDVLMYTPTVSAGVSFEALHFDCMFVNLSDRSCNVETARQMMGRVRQLRDKDSADTIIMGCAGMARYRDRLRDALDMPVVEPSQAAVTQAIGQIRCD